MASVNNLLGFLEKVGSSQMDLGIIARVGQKSCLDIIALCAAVTKATAVSQVFNGGSDFNEPVRRCLDRLHTAAWANSDILLVSDGELRQPGVEIMRKLAGLCCELWMLLGWATLRGLAEAGLSQCKPPGLSQNAIAVPHTMAGLCGSAHFQDNLLANLTAAFRRLSGFISLQVQRRSLACGCTG